MNKVDYPNLYAEGYRVEKVAQCFGGHGSEWWAYGPRGSRVNARFETKGEAMKACRDDFDALQARRDQQFDERGCEPQKLKIGPSTYPGVKTSFYPSKWRK